MKNKKISEKLMLAFLLVGVIPTITIAIISLIVASNSLSNSEYKKLESIRDTKVTQITSLFDTYETNLNMILNIVSTYKQEGFNDLTYLHREKEKYLDGNFDRWYDELQMLSGNKDIIAFATELDNYRKKHIKKNKDLDINSNDYRNIQGKYEEKINEVIRYNDFSNMYIINSDDGLIMFSKGEDKGLNLNINENHRLNKVWRRSLAEGKGFFTDYIYNEERDDYSLYAVKEIGSKGHESRSIIILEYKKDLINNFMQNREGYEQTGETYLVSKNSDNNYEFRSDMVTMGDGRYKVGFDSIESVPEYWVDTDELGYIQEVYTDSAGKLVMIVADKYEKFGLDWMLISKVDFEAVIDKQIAQSGISIYENFVSEFGFYDLTLIHPEGEVFYSVAKGSEYHTNILNGSYSKSGLGFLARRVLDEKKMAFRDFSPYAPSNGERRAFLAVPFMNKEKVEFIIAVQISIEAINDMVGLIGDEVEDGEVYLVGRDKLPRSDIRSYGVSISEDIKLEEINNKAINLSLEGESFTERSEDKYKKDMISAYAPLNIGDTVWALVAQVDRDRALASVNMLVNVITALTIITILVIVYVSIRVSRGISRPIKKLSTWAEDISKGKTELVEVEQSTEEIDKLARGFRSVVGNFEEIETICSEISKGDFDRAFDLRSEDDELGKSINLMREKFVTVIDKANRISEGDYELFIEASSETDQLSLALAHMTNSLRDAKEESDIQNYIKNGQALINDVMQGDHSTLDLAKSIITSICKYLDIPLGTIFVNEADKYKMLASYAYTHRKNHKNIVEAGEGLLGQAIVEKELILIENIPTDYLAIESSLGSTSAKELVLLPCVYNKEVVAVVELATIEKFDNKALDLLKLISESIAIAINTSEARYEIKKLLEKSIKQAKELQAQQEELRVTNEELEEQTKSLRESEKRLQQQQEELRVTNEELEEQTKTLKDSERKLQQQQEELRVINEELEDRTNSLEEQKRVINDKNLRLEKAQEEIIKKARDLEVASTYKSEFLANMSHELRTPLNSILILSQLLLENKLTNLSDTELEYAKTIKSSGGDLLNLINDILDLSKVEAGKMEVHVDTFNIRTFVEGIDKSFKTIIEKKDLKFKLKVDKSVPSNIETDEQRVNQIIKNLISNAIKFTEEGSISLKVYLPDKASIRNENLKDRDVIAIQVADTGIGIAENKLKSIFEAFQQADGTTSRKFGGTGLGLSISKEFTSLLGGELHVASEVDKGSEFSIYLPLEYEANEKKSNKFNASTFIEENLSLETIEDNKKIKEEVKVEKVAEEVLSTQEPTLTKGEHILIVEDDENFSLVLKNLAKEKGFDSLVCHSGEEALELLKESKPTALILDIGLPGISGWDLLEEVRKDKNLADIPVHVMSGMEPDEKIQQLGVVDYFKKPIGVEKINSVFEKIKTLIDKDLKRVLVVEDSIVHSESIKAFLESHSGDLEVVPCESAGKTLELLKTDKFDTMILDLGLADMSGIELLTKIRREDISQIPIIIYTGKDLTEEENMQLEKYAETVIIKGPESMNRLLDEANLFLHHIDNKLAEKKHRIIQSEYNKENNLVAKKVLVVDDDIRNVFALSSVLEAKGMKVEVARNGIEALDVLDEVEGIDLVLMDIMMPEMDGYTAMRAIRKKSNLQNLPIIALTAKAMKEDREKCINAGANDYMSKPIQVDKLLSLMRVWLY